MSKAWSTATAYSATKQTAIYSYDRHSVFHLYYPNLLEKGSSEKVTVAQLDIELFGFYWNRRLITEIILSISSPSVL